MQVAARDVELCVQLQGELNTLIQQMNDLERLQREGVNNQSFIQQLQTLTRFQQQLRDGVTLIRNAIEHILNLINGIRDELDNVNRLRQKRQEQERQE